MIVTKANERAVVPPVDDAARARLAEAFDEPDVVSALLFGSAGSRQPPQRGAARRLARAARQRDLLVHAYLEIDDRTV